MLLWVSLAGAVPPGEGAPDLGELEQGGEDSSLDPLALADLVGTGSP